MELRNLTQFPTDYLDAYCEQELGHTNWEFVHKNDLTNGVYATVIFYTYPEEEDE
tara:strand:+ start:1325 stop:1489 length:165 start_codon:yes stop_codon:yes gene_type:complete